MWIETEVTNINSLIGLRLTSRQRGLTKHYNKGKCKTMVAWSGTGILRVIFGQIPCQFLAYSVKSRNSAIFSAMPKNYTKIQQNLKHFKKMRRNHWKFRKCHAILFHQILQIRQSWSNYALKFCFFSKIMCYSMNSVVRNCKFSTFFWGGSPCGRVNSVNSAVMQITRKIPVPAWCHVPCKQPPKRPLIKRGNPSMHNLSKFTATNNTVHFLGSAHGLEIQ